MPVARSRIVVHPLSWRSRYLRGLLLAIAAVVGLRLLWGWHTARTLGAQLDQIRARGEPASLAELESTFEDVPDAENAAALQLKAATVAMGTGVWSPSSSNDEYREFPPFPGYWTKRASASEAAHGQVFALARQARQLPRARFRTVLNRPVALGIVTPGYNQLRHLANTLKDGALYAHVRGDDVEAIERVRDQMHVTRSLQADPTLVSQLVGLGVCASATHAAQIIAPGLRFDKPGTRQAVRGLIADLLDEEADWRGFEASLRAERVIADDLIEWTAEPGWFVRPIADMEAVRRNRYLAAVIDVAPIRNWPEASAALDRIPREPAWDGASQSAMAARRSPLATTPRYSRFLANDPGLGAGSLRASFLTHFRWMSDRRMTAVSLAAQLYRADHGRWPARMEDLSPAYLAAIPVDPYRADGGSLEYVMAKLPPPLTGDRPLVYSRDVERPAGISAEPMYGFQTTASAANPTTGRTGQYRDLSRFEPPQSPPQSPQAVDGDPNKPDGPGGEAEKDDRAK